MALPWSSGSELGAQEEAPSGRGEQLRHQDPGRRCCQSHQIIFQEAPKSKGVPGRFLLPDVSPQCQHLPVPEEEAAQGPSQKLQSLTSVPLREQRALQSHPWPRVHAASVRWPVLGQPAPSRASAAAHSWQCASYTQNGILHMLDRNKRIKPRPERFQNCKDLFDLILTCEERVYDQVVEDLNSREQETCQPVHVVNVDIQDNHEEATLGAFLICELCQCIQHTEDMENEIDELLQEFEEKSGRTFLHTVCFY
uniref:RNA polymerase II subunit A C-terminal domain phosphatase SSU72 n=1 Tax=Rhinopithecus bieti TaxID=61621 RepID=A0A2K6KUR2_RHIBE